MPRYLFLRYDREDLRVDVPPEEWAGEVQRHRDVATAVEAADGARVVSSEALRPRVTATTVRMPAEDAEPLVTDGPVLGTEEALGDCCLGARADTGRPVHPGEEEQRGRRHPRCGGPTRRSGTSGWPAHWTSSTWC